MGFEPSALRQLQGVTPIEPAARREVDIFDTGVDDAQLCCGHAVGQAFVGTRGDFAIEHQTKPLLPAEIGGIVLFGQLPVGSRYSDGPFLH